MLLEVPEYAEMRYTYGMVTSLLHYNDVIDRPAVHFLSFPRVGTCTGISHWKKNSGDPYLVCKKYNF